MGMGVNCLTIHSSLAQILPGSLYKLKHSFHTWGDGDFLLKLTHILSGRKAGTHTHTDTHIGMCTHTHTQRHTGTHRHTQTHTHRHTHRRAHTHSHTHRRAHTHTHTKAHRHSEATQLRPLQLLSQHSSQYDSFKTEPDHITCLSNSLIWE